MVYLLPLEFNLHDNRKFMCNQKQNALDKSSCFYAQRSIVSAGRQTFLKAGSDH